MVVSYRMLTNISSEHFLNTATKDLFHSMRWFSRLNLNNPKWKIIFRGKSPCIILYACRMHIFHMFVFSSEYTWSSKAKILCLSTLSKTNRWPVSVPLSVISDYAITGSTPHCICEAAGRAESFRLMSHICASELDPGNWISIGSGNGWLPVWHQAITQSYPGLLSIVNLGKNFVEIRTKKLFISFMKMHMNILYFLWNIDHFVGGGGVKPVPLPTYLRVWLHGGAWNSLDTTEQTPLWNVITLGTADTHQAWPIAMVAHILASIRHQAISNHHADLIMLIVCHKYHVTFIQQTF